MRKTLENRDCSSVTGADLRIARQEQGGSTQDPLNDSELAPNSANGSIPSLIAWTVPKPPGNAATVSENKANPSGGVECEYIGRNGRIHHKGTNRTNNKKYYDSKFEIFEFSFFFVPFVLW
jgi:hypothetical protein